MIIARKLPTRRWLAVIPVILLLFLLPGCSGSKNSEPEKQKEQPAKSEQAKGEETQKSPLEQIIEGAKKEGKLVIWDALRDQESQKVAEGFNKVYPFVKIEHRMVSGPEPMEQLLRELPAGAVDLDLFKIGAEFISDFVQLGLLEKVAWDTLIPDVDPLQVDANGYWLAPSFKLEGISYNTNLVAPGDVPNSWEDALDPKWAGKFVVDTRPLTFLDLTGAWGEQKTIEYLTKLGKNKPIFRRGQSQALALLAAGEFPLEVGAFADQSWLLKGKGATINIVFPEPVASHHEPYAISKNAKNPNAAKLMLIWLNTKEGQKIFDAGGYRGLPFKKYEGITTAATEIKGKKLSVPTPEIQKRDAELTQKYLKALGAPGA